MVVAEEVVFFWNRNTSNTDARMVAGREVGVVNVSPVTVQDGQTLKKPPTRAFSCTSMHSHRLPLLSKEVLPPQDFCSLLSVSWACHNSLASLVHPRPLPYG